MSTVRARYYPAALRLPGEATPRRKQYVLLSDDGLRVWSRPQEEPDVHMPVDWAATPKLPTGRQARAGVVVQLITGEIVSITPGAGCRCGALGRWSGPSWASSVRAG